MASADRSTQQSRLPDVKVAPAGKIAEEEFVAWCDEDTRAEWSDGEVVMMSPPSVEHAELSTWLASLLRIFVEQHGLGRVMQEIQVRFAEPRRRRVPDIVFLAKGRQGLLRPTHLEGPPDLVVEIVSPDSEGRDWREKYLEYESVGVREYWVIDPMSQHAEVYALCAEGASGEAGYRRVEEQQGGITSTVLTGLRLKTAWLWPQTRPKVLEALRELGVLGSSNP